MFWHSLGTSSFATSGSHWLIAHSRSRVMRKCESWVTDWGIGKFRQVSYKFME